MTATSLPDDAPEPRTPWRRWVAAGLLAIPLAALWGAVVTAIGAALFLDERQETALRDVFDGRSPLVVMWVAAAVAGVFGIAFVVVELLNVRAARRDGAEGPLPGRARSGGRWPAVWTGSPVAAIALAWGMAALFRQVQGDEPGQAAFVFATLASAWLFLLVGVGWLFLVVRPSRAGDEKKPRRLAGIEEAWMQRAAAQCFWDVMMLLGVACLGTALLTGRADTSWIVMAVLFAAMVDFPVRLLVLKRREEKAA